VIDATPGQRLMIDALIALLEESGAVDIYYGHSDAACIYANDHIWNDLPRIYWATHEASTLDPSPLRTDHPLVEKLDISDEVIESARKAGVEASERIEAQARSRNKPDPTQRYQ